MEYINVRREQPFDVFCDSTGEAVAQFKTGGAVVTVTGSQAVMAAVDGFLAALGTMVKVTNDEHDEENRRYQEDLCEERQRHKAERDRMQGIIDTLSAKCKARHRKKGRAPRKKTRSPRPDPLDFVGHE